MSSLSYYHSILLDRLIHVIIIPVSFQSAGSLDPCHHYPIIIPFCWIVWSMSSLSKYHSNLLDCWIHVIIIPLSLHSAGSFDPCHHYPTIIPICWIVWSMSSLSHYHSNLLDRLIHFIIIPLSFQSAGSFVSLTQYSLYEAHTQRKYCWDYSLLEKLGIFKVFIYSLIPKTTPESYETV